ncbi:MAG TPA: tetratricopeptide repeat protein [Flavobacteriales bacterium]|nr:tetratricopeptide repeat protein [Flavobacteriales bacterium]
MSRSQVLVLAGAGVLTVLLLLASRTPPGKEQAAAQAPDPIDLRVQEAVALVNGTQPMQGIMMLREILQEDPDNVEAHWNLGLFSVQSGQYDKAVERFQKVLELDPEGHSEAWFYLGRTYATMDSTDLAIAAFNEYRSTVTDTAIINGVDRFVMQLNNEKAEHDALRKEEEAP